MRPSSNYDSKDPKFSLLSKIFKIIASKKVLNIYNRNGVTNHKMMDLTIKVSFLRSYSTTKSHFIGFKATVVLDKKRLTPVSILIHSEAPSDTKIFDNVLKELKRRRIIQDGNIMFFNH